MKSRQPFTLKVWLRAELFCWCCCWVRFCCLWSFQGWKTQLFLDTSGLWIDMFSYFEFCLLLLDDLNLLLFHLVWFCYRYNVFCITSKIYELIGFCPLWWVISDFCNLILNKRAIALILHHCVFTFTNCTGKKRGSGRSERSELRLRPLLNCNSASQLQLDSNNGRLHI